MCACQEPICRQDIGEEEVAISVSTCAEEIMVTIDTAALSIWVDYDWYTAHGGKILSKGGSACAADGREIGVVGTGKLKFAFWGLSFVEEVRVMTHLPDKMLIGQNFWRNLGLRLDLERNSASVKRDGVRVEGPVGSRKQLNDEEEESVRATIEDADVDQALKDMDLRAFSENPSKRNRLRKLLWKRRAIFKGLGKIVGIQHKIALKPDVRPVCEPLRRRSPREEEVERLAMDKLVKMGVLESAVSPWAAENVFVRKKDGGIRVTSDFRRLNDLTVTDSYRMENVRDTLNWLATKRVFSVFDLKDGFYQVELHPDSKACTAIRTVLGLLQFTRLPQGLKNAPGTFQRIINMILGDRKGRDVLAFMDDTSIGTANEDEHLESLATVLDLLFEAGVRLKLSKCKFGFREAEILGHMVDEHGLRPSDKHLEAIQRLEMPRSGDELTRFLGLVNYFADFVDHFAETAAPLYAALKGTGFSKKRRHGQRLVIPDWKARWGKDQTKAWKELKDALSNPEILAAPRRGAAKRVMTDASAYGLGGVLLQETKDGKWQPVSFTSRLLRKAERNYAPTEREFLAVIHALQKWRHYLHGEHFTVVTDHLSLKWLLSLKDPREKLARWVIEVQDFDFTTEHRSGPELVVPDTLSRDAVLKPLCRGATGNWTSCAWRKSVTRRSRSVLRH